MLRRRKNKPIEDTAENALRTAVALMACKDNTKKELYEKLAIRGYSHDHAMQAVNFAEEKGYLSEKRYLARYVESCVENLYGKKRIVMSAKKKGFPEEMITEELFEGIDFKENCYIAMLKSRKCDQNKMRNILMRRGFSSAEATYCFKRYLNEYGEAFGADAEEEADELFEDGLSDYEA